MQQSLIKVIKNSTGRGASGHLRVVLEIGEIFKGVMTQPINSDKPINLFKSIYTHYLIFIFIFLLPLFGVSQTTYTFHTAGNWTNAANWSPSYPGTYLDNLIININANCSLSENIILNQNVSININSAVIFPVSALYIATDDSNSSGNTVIVSNSGSIIGNYPNSNSTLGIPSNNNSNHIINNGTISNLYITHFGSSDQYILTNYGSISGRIEANSSALNYGTIEASIGTSGNFNNYGTINGDIGLDGYLTNFGYLNMSQIISFGGDLTNSGTIIGNPIITNYYINQGITYSYDLTLNIGNNSILSPGNSSGKITFDLIAPFADCVNIPVFSCDINGITPETQYDQIAVTNCANLSDATLNVTWGFTPSVGQSFDIITHGSRNGQFANVNIPPISGLSFIVDYTDPSKTSIVVSQALPITINNFNVVKKNSDINLYWQTSSEINNHYFDIEYSTDGTDFTAIGRKEGAGNINTLLDYHFVHKDVDAGIHYYRLRQVDYDGQYSYSDIKSTVVKGEGNDVTIYPNPATNIINVNGADGLYYALYDLVGTLVHNGQISDDAISIDHLATGMYYLHLDSDAGQSVYKIWKE